jgi:hypothetical protein
MKGQTLTYMEKTEWGEVSMGGADTSPTSLIVHFVVFHCTAVVPITALETKEFAR